MDALSCALPNSPLQEARPAASHGTATLQSPSCSRCDPSQHHLSPVEAQPVSLKHTGELGAGVLQGLHEVLLAERTDLGRVLQRRKTVLRRTQNKAGNTRLTVPREEAAQGRGSYGEKETAQPALRVKCTLDWQPPRLLQTRRRLSLRLSPLLIFQRPNNPPPSGREVHGSLSDREQHRAQLRPAPHPRSAAATGTPSVPSTE